jgi:hypothetical protein
MNSGVDPVDVCEKSGVCENGDVAASDVSVSVVSFDENALERSDVCVLENMLYV